MHQSLALRSLIVFVAVGLSGCGASYLKGKTEHNGEQQEITWHYPDPELALDVVPSLDASAKAQGCATQISNDLLTIACPDMKNVTLVFGANGKNKSVLMGTCLGKIEMFDCEQAIKKIIAGRK